MSHGQMSHYLHDFAGVVEFGLGLLEFFLFFFVFGKFEAFFGDGDEVFAVIFTELLYAVFVDGFAHVEDLEATFDDALDEGRVLDNVDGLAGDEVNVLLVVLHAGDIVGEGGSFFAAVVG